jgi:hypothetical protein
MRSVRPNTLGTTRGQRPEGLAEAEAFVERNEPHDVAPVDADRRVPEHDLGEATLLESAASAV